MTAHRTVGLLGGLLLAALASGLGACCPAQPPASGGTPAASAQAMPIADVVAKRQELIGTRVTIEGIAVEDVGFRSCTLIGCDPQCCNHCNAPLLLVGQSATVALAGSASLAEVGCSGNECDVVCSPLVHGKSYRVTGVVAGASLAEISNDILWQAVTHPVVQVEYFELLSSL